ncbi:sensor kinase/response regulator fusion protein [Caballeronia temeraria]|uniref:histidine kinase n=1 Tax=Caballeronia temeraria TaxID=1777137 RepID=A0A158BWX1_9BURK|nr:ATP-binding protein [Caballeronia temeraria]SAK74614.1 sensor kinase/response regulator fusion protein [Caballeronia temeraria]
METVEPTAGVILIYAPTGRDADVIRQTLHERGIAGCAVASFDEACHLLHRDEGVAVGGMIVAEEALGGATAAFTKCLSNQPAWSDLPICLLTVSGGPESPRARWRFFESLGNVTLLARRLPAESLVSAARGLLRARARQLQTKHHLDELNGAAQTLERRVEQRTEELMAAQETLRQAQKMEAIGQLTGGLAHDFNNLLQVVNSNMELVQLRIRQGRAADIERQMRSAHEATQRAAALTHRLLAFSRRQTLDPKPVSLNRLVLGMLSLIERTIGPSVSIHADLGTDVYWTMCDPPQLENAVLNLCINARDAMPDGGALRIRTENTTLVGRAALLHDLPAGDYVILSVADTGCGMTVEVASKAFDPFFTTKPLGQGTGLGLSMIYGFTRQSGGKATIESEVGAGTVVSIYLPRLIAEQPQVEEAPLAESIPSAVKRKTVLVVDDEPEVRTVSAEVLREAGYNVLEAAEGITALSLLGSNLAIDMLVTDIGMPGMNGKQLADRARLARPDLKVLFITGFAEKTAFPSGNVDPGSHLLNKPFPIRELALRVGQIVNGTV